MSIYDEEPTELTLPDGLYQLILLHDGQGLMAHDAPSFDLGIFDPATAGYCTTYMASASEEAKLEAFDGVVGNVLEAWSSPYYRVWLIPVDAPGAQCWEYANEGLVLVPFNKDPR